MKSATLRKRVTIQRRSTAEDALGQQLLTWETIGTVWAEVEQISGRELLTASAERAENTARVTVRYRPDLVEKMRLLYGSIIYDITSVSDLDGRKRQLEVMCKTGVSNG